MPSAPQRACTAFGCGQVEPCPQHGRRARRQAYDDRRGSASSRGYGASWRDYRVWFIGETMRRHVARAGLCGARLPGAPQTADSQCTALGRTVAGRVVDHIVPVRGPHDARFYDTTNHQLLCDECHNRKRQRESQQARASA